MKLVDQGWALDRATRDRIQTDLGTSMLVEAAAGTGKTTQLIGRLVAVITTGATTVDKIVAVTFTRKAAGELKLRLREALEEARADTNAVVRERVEAAIAHLEETRIGTIHSFCADLLRQRPVEAGVDPDFAEVADDEGPRLFARAFDRWIQDQFEVMPEGLRRALSRLALESGYQGGQRSTPLERLRDAAWKLAEWRDYPAAWQRPPFDRVPLIDRLVDLVARLASHARRANHKGDRLRNSLEPVVILDTWIRRAGFDLLPKPETPSTSPLPDGVLRFPSTQAEQVETEDPFARVPEGGQHWTGKLETRDYDALEARLLELRVQLRRPQNKHKGRGKFAEALPREQVIEERDLFLECLDHFQRVANADLAALLQRELRGVLPEYERTKHSEGRLDFSDLLLLTRLLLVTSADVRNTLQEQISHLFIDEFQDTDPVQAEVLLLLAADDPSCVDWREVRPAPGKLFVVGDPKQSIYRFRRADVRLYEGIKERLRERGTAILELGRSFRANSGIQRFVNAAFAPLMDADAAAGRPSYLALGEFRQAPEGQPAVVSLPVPSPYKWKYLSQRAIEESQPKAVAAYCDWLINKSGFKVERDGDWVPVTEADICILFRRYLSWGRDVTRPYTQALEDRGITHLLIGARTFHQREEIETLRAALLAIEHPDEELVCFATLRGSLFSFSDELLLRYRAAVGGFSAFAWQAFHKRNGQKRSGKQPSDKKPTGSEFENPRVNGELEPVGEVLDLLVKLHRLRNRRAVVETVQELLDTTRARAGFALRPAGHQVLANVERICELARAYEMTGGRSFRGFVERLEAQAARPTSAEAPVVEDGAEGVRIMTVHAAKGLEFRVVILADMTANIAIREPDAAVDADTGLCATKLLGCAPIDLIQRMDVEKARDHAEGVRVAYVAATRARDLLVVPAVGDEARPGWIEPLNSALYPENPRDSEPSPGCPEFGERSVLERPMELESPGEAAGLMGSEDPSVKPGLHRFEGSHGRYSVTWWDPAVLHLDVKREVGLAREGLLSPKVLQQLDGAGSTAASAPAVERNLERYRSWQIKRASILASGSAPSREVEAVTAIDAEPPGGIRTVALQTVRRVDSCRPSGLRFGELVHSVLQLVDLRRSQVEIIDQARELALMTARIIGASDRERDAAVEAVGELAGSSLGAELRAATGLWREFPLSAKVTIQSEDGIAREVVVDAVIDLMFTNGSEIVVVDFKTDAALLASVGTAGSAHAIKVPGSSQTGSQQTGIQRTGDQQTDNEQTGSPIADGPGSNNAPMTKYCRQLSWYAELLESSGNLASLLSTLEAPPEANDLELRLVQI